jgi:GNAT superfamily N-acetyltransferase
VTVTQANADDIPGLARLLWLNHVGDEPTAPSLVAFAAQLSEWWAAHQSSHFAFVARIEGAEIVGMAWVALVARPPRPGDLVRASADIQSVFVMPPHRNRGLGSELVRAAADHATAEVTGLGAARVTVHSGRLAVPVYERLGFESSPQMLQRPPD